MTTYPTIKVKIVPSAVKDFYKTAFGHLKELAERIDIHLQIAEWCEDDADAEKHVALAVQAFEYYQSYSQSFNEL